MTQPFHNSALMNGTNLLPEDPVQAIQTIIKVTQSLIAYSERENQHLARNDMMGFAILQDEKSIMADRYVRVSREFRNRIEEFRGLDKAYLDKLEGQQKILADNSRTNNALIGRIKNKAEQKTQSTLLSAQELGQSKPVRFHDLKSAQDMHGT